MKVAVVNAFFISVLLIGYCRGWTTYNAMQLAYFGEFAELGTNSSNFSDSGIESQVILYLFTRNNDREILEINENSLRQSHFDLSKPTKIIIHGFFGSIRRPMTWEIKDRLLEAEDVNVIIVDWSKIAISINYFKVVRRSPEVGYYVAALIDFLVEEGSHPKGFHLIGHSIGAHVAGIVGSTVKSARPARITGLDPAKPEFHDADNSKRLDQSDADFVDVIHTCGGLLGLNERTGHADFYPNGGKNIQPGCYFFDFGRCSHLRSHEFFAESIIPDHPFPALLCSTNDPISNSCIDEGEKMGYYSKPSARGVYYLRTNKGYPYSIDYTERTREKEERKSFWPRW